MKGAAQKLLKGLFCVFLLILLAAGAIGLFLVLFPSQVGGWVAAGVQKSLNGSISIDHLRITAGSIRARNIVLRDSREKVLAEVGEIALDLSLKDCLSSRSLLGGVRNVSIQKPRLVVERGPKGDLNWDRFVVGPAGAEARPGEEPAPWLKFQGSVKIDDGLLSFSDAADNKYFSSTFGRIGGLLDFSGKNTAGLDVKWDDEDEAATGNLGCRGWLKKDLSQWNLSLSGKRLNASKWGNYILNNPDVTVTGGTANVALSINGSAGEDIGGEFNPGDLQGDVNLDGVSLRLRGLSGEFSRISGSLFLTNDVVSAGSLKGSWGSIPFYISGDICNFFSPKLNLLFKAPRIPLEELSGYLGLKQKGLLRGEASAQVKIRGDAMDPLLEGSITSAGCLVASQPLTDVSVVFFNQLGLLHLRDFKANWLGSRVHGSGLVLADKSPSLSLRLEARSVDPRAFAGSLGGFSGKGDLDISMVGQGADPVVTGSAVFNGVESRFVYGGKNLWLDGRLGRRTSVVARGLADPWKNRINLGFLVSGRDVPAGEVPGWGPLHLSADMHGRVQGSLSSPLARVRISRGKVSLGSFCAGEIAGNLLYGNHTLCTPGIRGNLADSPVFIEGFRNFGEDEDFYLRMHSPHLSPASFSKADSLPGEGASENAFSALAEISGRGEDYALRGAMWRHSGSLNLTARHGRTGSWWALGKIDGLELDGLLPAGADAFGQGGKVSGMVFLGGGPKGGIFLADGIFNGSSLLGMPIDKVRADGSWNGGKVSVSDLFLAGESAAVSLRGILVPARRLADLEWKIPWMDLSSLASGFIDPAMQKLLVGWKQPQIGGTAYGRGFVRGTFPGVELVGNLDIHDGFAGHSPFALDSAFALSPQEITLEPLVLSHSGGQYKLSGKAGLGRDGKIDLFLETVRGNLSTLLSLTPLGEWGLRGLVDSRLRLRGGMKSPRLIGDLSIKNLYVGNHRVDRVRAHCALDREKIGTDIDFALFMQRHLVRGRMNMNPQGMLDGHMEARDFPLESLADIHPSLKTLGGIGNLNVSMSGTFDKTEARADLDLKKLCFRGLVFDSLKGNFAYDSRGVTFGPVYLARGEGQYDFSGFIPAGVEIFPVTWKRLSGRGSGHDSRGLSLRAEVRRGRLEDLLTLAGYPQAGDFNGEINGCLEAIDLYAHPVFDARLSLQKGSIGPVPVSQIVLESKYSGTEFALDNFIFHGGNGNAEARGLIDLQGETSLAVNLDSMDLRLLGVFLPQARRMGGILDLQLDATGSTFIPEIRTSFNLKNGTWGWLTFDSLSGNGGASNGMVFMKELKLMKGRHQALASGNLPLALKNGKLASEGPLNLKASLEEDDLDSLNVFGNIVSQSSGKLRGNASVTGTASDFRMEGILEVKNASLTLAHLKNAIRDFWARIVLKGEHLVVEEFRGKMGAGTFNLLGTADFVKGRLAGANFDFAARAVQVISNELTAIITTTRGLAIKVSDGGRLLLKGDLSVSDATLKIPAAVPQAREQEESKQTLSTLTGIVPADIDVALTLEKNVWLSLNVARMISSSLNSRGTVAFRKQADKAQMGGDIHFIGGLVTLFNRPFHLTSGLAHFDGSDSIVPEVELNLEAKSSERIIFADVSGRPPNLSVSLTSDPPSSQAQIERGLIKGMADSALVGFMDTGLLQPLTLAIQRSFGLSDVAFDYTMSGAQSLRVAKSLGPDERLLISYTRLWSGLGEIQRLWGIEYLLFKRTILKFTQDDKGVNTFGIQSRFYF
jgi:hypothetical protein